MLHHLVIRYFHSLPFTKKNHYYLVYKTRCRNQCSSNWKYFIKWRITINARQCQSLSRRTKTFKKRLWSSIKLYSRWNSWYVVNLIQTNLFLITCPCVCFVFPSLVTLLSFVHVIVYQIIFFCLESHLCVCEFLLLDLYCRF